MQVMSVYRSINNLLTKWVIIIIINIDDCILCKLIFYLEEFQAYIVFVFFISYSNFLCIVIVSDDDKTELPIFCFDGVRNGLRIVVNIK